MTGYDQGRRFEWLVRDYLRDNGYEVIRAAGSKTKADLIALKPGQILIVQCKRTSIPGPSERREIVRLAQMVQAVPIVATRGSRGTGGPLLRRITDDGSSPRALEVFVVDEVATSEVTA